MSRHRTEEQAALGLDFDPDEAYPGAKEPTTSGGLGLNAQVPADLPAEHVDEYLETGERPK
jgi:hypothetical protein